MEVITILSDKRNEGFEQCLKPSCKHFNLSLKVLESLNWETHRFKDKMLLNYLESKCKEEIILVTDAYDTFFLADEKEIIEKYKGFGKDIVFSAEMNCWPDLVLAKEYPEVSTPFKYLNSGAFIGKTETIYNCLTSHYEEITNMKDLSSAGYLWSNQIIWSYIFLKTDKIELDSSCEIFYTTSSSKIDYNIPGINLNHNYYQVQELLRLINETTKDRARIKINTTSAMPCHIHYNGVARKKIMHATYWDDIKSWKL